MNDTLFKLEQTIAARKGTPKETSYVAALNAKGLDAILKKVGEEATEAVIAAKGGNREELIKETADLLFHTLVMLGYRDISLDEVLQELARREGTSGLDEKQARSGQ